MTQIENIRLETAWSSSHEGFFRLPVYQGGASQIAFFYQTGSPTHPGNSIRYGVQVLDPQGERILLDRQAASLEEALSEFERLYPQIQTQGQQVLDSGQLSF
ncbi:hypothetical protein [Deinococcus roseus]|uniref:Uncharacterized protein n=1 Tax=Deinococcus roseus TaxID=392414 RepID=A0ABQ2DCK8_9DEIO|nr:hypothetical protein [Deinococcus roseus]GGJ53677.1 hypothetical protein GCM10008938_44660 [Deinococcus roseus]